VWGTGILSRTVVLSSWVAIALIAAGYLAWRITRDRHASASRWASPLIAVVIAVWLATGARGKPLGEIEAFLPPSEFAPAAGSVSLSWILNDHAKALATASASNQLVFIDFTGYTCTNCRWMEANMFARADVSQSLSRYVLSRLYTDGEGEMYERQQQFQEENFGTVALPLYAIVDGKGRTVRTFSGLTRNPREFLAFLRNAS
jgi:thiol:disulfide interchange protein DsbD